MTTQRKKFRIATALSHSRFAVIPKKLSRNATNGIGRVRPTAPAPPSDDHRTSQQPATPAVNPFTTTLTGKKDSGTNATLPSLEPGPRDRLNASTSGQPTTSARTPPLPGRMPSTSTPKETQPLITVVNSPMRKSAYRPLPPDAAGPNTSGLTSRHRTLLYFFGAEHQVFSRFVILLVIFVALAGAFVGLVIRIVESEAFTRSMELIQTLPAEHPTISAIAAALPIGSIAIRILPGRWRGRAQ